MPSDSKFDDKVKCRSTVGTLRAASENYKQSGRCTQSPYVAMESATLTRHRLTSQSIFQGPRSPYITEHEQIKDRKAGLKLKAASRREQ